MPYDNYLGDYMNIKKIVLTLLLCLVFSSMQATIKQVTAKVGGMVCVACTSVVGNHLKKIDGIKSVSDIDFKTGFVTIEFTDDNTFTKETLKDILNDALKKSTYQFEGIENIIEK